MKKIFILILASFSSSVLAEPWIDTRDAWLRADIEYLSDIGVIKGPVTTWPLMWAPILNDLKEANINDLSDSELRIYKRVKRKGRYETKLDTHSYLTLKAGNQGKILRNFGDDRREKAEITSKTSGMNKNFAWNIEATRAYNPIDGEESRFDHSYVAAIWGNWVLSVGSQERWWGPGWDSSLLLSNNARPVPAVSVQRNYSDPFENKWLSWMGPWTFNAFAGQLESDRHIPHAKLLGMSFNFKPLDSLEIGLRRTAQWAGDGRPNSLSSLWNLFIGNSNCDEVGLGCDDRSQEPGNQLAGIDFKWRLPSRFGSVYGQLIGEDEAGYLPSRKFFQFGYTNTFELFEMPIKSFAEYSDTENDIGPNTTYEHGLYQVGYRTEGRSIGSTYDGDSQSVTLGLLADIDTSNQLKLSVSNIDLNHDGTGLHTLSNQAVSFNKMAIDYRKITKYGILGVQIDFKDKAIDTFNYQKDKYNIALSWTMTL